MSSQRELEDRTVSFFSQAGFYRLLPAIWGRYASLGKTGGHAKVPNATHEECEAINSFMGSREKAGTTVRLRLLDFEKELRESVFPYDSIPDLHKLLVGKILLTKSDEKLLAEEGWQQLFSNVERQSEESEFEPALRFWLSELQQGTAAAGYRMLRDLWKQSPATAELELMVAVRAWNNRFTIARQLGGSTLRLPVLAASISGDSHALDRTTSAGRLLFRGLWFVQERRMRDSKAVEAVGLNDDDGAIDSLRAREIYRTAGILDDDLSSLVHVYHADNGTDAHPYVMTLRQVEAMVKIPLVSDIYIVENPPVFSTLVDCWGTTTGGEQDDNECGRSTRPPLLLCTSGPASAAALRLLDLYIREESWEGKLYYSGDYDVKGLGIGNVLANRYPDHFVPWRFDTENYINVAANVRTVPFSIEECNRLRETRAVWDPELTTALKENGEKIYQEQLILLLMEDWNRARKVL